MCACVTAQPISMSERGFSDSFCSCVCTPAYTHCSHHWRTAIDIVLFASMRSLPCATVVRLMGTLWGVMCVGCTAILYFINPKLIVRNLDFVFANEPVSTVYRLIDYVCI